MTRKGRKSFWQNLFGEIDREALEHQLGLDVPVWVQYGRWIGDILLHGTLGQSLLTSYAVEAEILERLPVTLELGVQHRRHRPGHPELLAGRDGDDLSGPLVGLGAAAGAGCFHRRPVGNLAVFLIPSLILGTASAAATMRMTRTMMLEVLRQDYVRTAWAKGLRERLVVVRHAIKNALIPVVTRSVGLIGRAAAAQPLCGLQLPILVGGAVIMENIFNLPGLGRLLLSALNERDYPMVSGIKLFFATGVVLLNLLIDLIYPYLDPRVRYE